MPTAKHIAPGAKVGLKLTAAQRKVIVDDLTCLDARYVQVIKDTPAGQPVQFTLDDWDDLGGYVAAEANHAEDKRLGKKLDAIFDKVQNILDTYTEEEPPKTSKTANPRKAGKRKAETATATVFQFKITLNDVEPPIWRRIQIKDCTLDTLHEHIQTAMGWTNSHLHQFEIGGVRHGDPELLCDGCEDETPPVNSLSTKVSKIIPEDGRPFGFQYDYDFGDDWRHEILFEGCLNAKKGTRFPLCMEGQRACPPDDVGGPYGYADYLEAMADPKHKQHKDFMEWNGPFDSEEFDARAATKRMQRGLPDWREME
jgi:hypothetical protein